MLGAHKNASRFREALCVRVYRFSSVTFDQPQMPHGVNLR